MAFDYIIGTTQRYIQDNLFPIIDNSGDSLEGNIFTDHRPRKLAFSVNTDVKLTKQRNQHGS